MEWTNCVLIKEGIYLSVEDESGPAVTLDAQQYDKFVYSSNALGYVLENRTAGHVSILQISDYDPFVCKLFNEAGETVPLGPLGRERNKVPEADLVKAKGGSFYQLDSGPGKFHFGVLFKITDYFTVPSNGNYLLEVRVRLWSFVGKKCKCVLSPPVRIPVIVTEIQKRQ